MTDLRMVERATQLKQELEWRRCRDDWFYWLKTYVWTKDEHDKANPFKPFFSEGDLPYIKLLGDLYLNERRLIFLKSRQLRVTWLCCALDLHEAMFHSARLIPINAYKEDDAADILDRIQFIYEGQDGDSRAPGLPAWMRARAPAERMKKPHQLKFPGNGSLIRAVAEGQENIRGKTVSRWRNEESRSQPSLEGTCQGVIPSLQKTGQAVFVSSAGQGYFESLVFDKIDPGDPPPREMIETGLHGVTMWRNARNKYLVVRIHYTADPNKRDPAWLATVTEGMPDYQVAMEYEIDFSARGGKPALTFFVENRAKIVVNIATMFPGGIPRWWPRIAHADYGTTNPYSCHFSAISPAGVLVTYWEYYSPGALGDHLSVITAHPDWELIQLYILDKSCWARTQQVSSQSVDGQTLHGLRSIADLHIELGVNPTPATVTSDTVKVEALAREWKRTNPTTLIGDNCLNLLTELPGIKWAPLAPTAVHQQEKLIDRDNHAFDDLCYGVLHYRESGLNPEAMNRDLSYEEMQQLVQKTVALAHMDRLQKRHEGTEDYGEYGAVEYVH